MFADDKIHVNVTQKLKFVLRSVENILGKGENAGYQHFLLFPKMFSKAFFLRVVKEFTLSKCKNLNLPKMETFADDIINIAQKMRVKGCETLLKLKV